LIDEHCFVNAKLLYQKIHPFPPCKTPNLFDIFYANHLNFAEFSGNIKWEKVREVFRFLTRIIRLLDTTFHPCNFSFFFFVGTKLLLYPSLDMDASFFRVRPYHPPAESRRAGREIYRMENSVSSAALNAAREQLDAAEAAREVILLQHIANGVIIDSRTVQIAPDVVIAPGAVILAGTILRGRTVIGAGCIIGPNTLIEDSIVDEGSTVNASQVYSSHIGPHNNIGPFTHVRVNTVTDYGVHLGAYVETKNSNFARGNTVSHLTYIGDSDVGKYCNFGCGTVTCNYDGKDKFRTQIGDYCFIGCNTNLVAPVKVGDGAYTAAGSTITKDVPAQALGIARDRQTNLEGWAEPKMEAYIAKKKKLEDEQSK
jgi:bifunctional UDP-N-acetylglucosamine pyrophosphorylase/glucosamine-1-phosphate N-acetyltransferase